MTQKPRGGGKREAAGSVAPAGDSQQSSQDSGTEDQREATPSQLPIVGVGASAGGVAAFQSFVRSLPAESGIAWVLIQHMAPDRPSELAQILQRQTDIPVVEVTETTAVEADRVYVIAPGRTMTISGGVLRLAQDDDPIARRTSIDAFLLSLAEDRGGKSGCALLSGAGSDGTLGLKAIKEAGGLTVTQALGSAEYDSMLLSAVRTGLVDRELEIGRMPAAFVSFLIKGAVEAQVGDGERLRICQLLRQATGHDFSGYKSSTVDRRIRRRMQIQGAATLSEYLEHLGGDKAEATLLFRDLLIGVTAFFRDPESFAALSATVLPKILEGKTADDEVRVWSLGCSTGEEAYSLAMLLQEQVDRLDAPPTLRIFGSDIDESALQAARLGRYPKSIAADLSTERLERFFEAEDGTYCIRGQLREMCLFAQHNVLRDPPFSRIDLVVCRNVLIYMNPELQQRLAPVLHYALRPDGYLFLGPAESASQAPKLFREVDRKHRIHQRVGTASEMPDFPLAAQGRGPSRRPGAWLERRPEAPLGRAARRVLAEFAPSYVVIDGEYDIVEVSGATGDFLELPSGRPRANLAAMVRSGLAIDIKAAIAKASASGRREVRSDLVIGTGEKRRQLTVVVEPLPREPGGEALSLVVFQKGPVLEGAEAGPLSRDGDDEVARALELELQSTKERLQTTLEDLETSNQELKAVNEELSSVNEELQSSNEELETSKEELQSINEELHTVNNELTSRVEELSRANNDLKNLFATTRIAMLFLDRRYRIMNFTPPAKELFHLRDHDLGRPLDELAGRIDSGGLRQAVERVIGAAEPLEEEIDANAEGERQTFIMRILPYRDADERVQGAVLTFIDITERKQSEQRLADMVSELNHRVKNALASVQAMVRQARSGASSVEEFGQIVEGRLMAMAAAHNLLSDRSWEHAGLRRLAETVLGPFAAPGSGRLTLAGPEAELRPRLAVSMSLILHELATNAAKYGAWSTPEGRVELGWQRIQEDGGHLRVAWQEADGPEVEAPEREGFGLRFIRQSTSYELQGRCETSFAAEGFSCRFELPADGVQWR